MHNNPLITQTLYLIVGLVVGFFCGFLFGLYTKNSVIFFDPKTPQLIINYVGWLIIVLLFLATFIGFKIDPALTGLLALVIGGNKAVDLIIKK